ncbi:MAG: RNA polymerase sigma-54 factor [Nitrospirae bacterium CG_4_9_14_3_um_filter_41_27]|nr:MAG: RNA polymerase sigma-54 factor [Nitrospirae bacterium CG2_30_41_42]PIV41211.1 MAG: RNA polymerase sigma-54 factor [Nitrospirae bacterium CG02_land_8_20_14_3_00_41_53]PJA78797.1 MAG: RNA polymerase sigma-54 factor [Nitrospirae bacterium CG_4_9_14_3_um_filter_41_27]
MALGNRLELRLSQKLILTPQLQQAIKLLQLPHLELSEFLSQELIENPFLEESVEEIPVEELTQEEKESVEIQEAQEDAEVPLEKLMNFTVDEYFEERGYDGKDLGYFNPGIVSPPSFEQFLTRGPDIYDHLLWQLRFSNEPESIRKVGEVIIGNIDENGYLRASIEEIIEAAKTQRETAEKALSLIQGFDPIGVGARNITECLLLQLNALRLSGTLVEKIIINNMDELEKKKYPRIAQQYNLPLKDIMNAVKIIEGLEPKPGRNFSNDTTNYVVPDVFLTKIAGGYQIVLNDEGLPRLRVSSFYKKLMQQHNAFPKEDKQFLIEKLRSAVGLLKSLDQRDRTIYRVTESLLSLQKEFFDKGIKYLKPLTLRDVASVLNMHESTISRVTSSKYLSCEHGTFCFRFLFSSALQSGIGSVSSTSVKDIIKKIVIEEDSQKPLSDHHIVEMLKSSGIIIARRTVTKYRGKLGIPSQTQRRKFG